MPVDPRQELPAGYETVLTQLLSAIKEALTDAGFNSPNAPNADPAFDDVKLFDFVDFGVLEDIQQQETPACRIEQGDEEIEEMLYPLTTKTKRVYIHFKVVKAFGVDPAPLITYYFGRITEVLVTPEHFADIAMDISEAGNSPQSQGKDDPEPGGTIYFDVQYRHGRGNYFSETGNG